MMLRAMLQFLFLLAAAGMVRADSTPEPQIGAHGLRLPASFAGILPCADCAGVRHHLDLWPYQIYHLRREWLGKADAGGQNLRGEIGRWFADPARQTITLVGSSETPPHWQVVAPDRLRLLDLRGRPIISALNHDLAGDGNLHPADLPNLVLTGNMRYMADAAGFTECLSRRTFPIATEGAYRVLERAYLAEGVDPGAKVLVQVRGRILMRPAMEGADRPHLVVDRFISADPAGTCADDPPGAATADLTNTYWRVDNLMGHAVDAPPGTREPHFVLQGGAEARFRATMGCNQLIGSYSRDGEALTFGPMAGTRMACPPPLDILEQRLGQVLSATRSYGIKGQNLELRDAQGAIIALCEAVYLR